MSDCHLTRVDTSEGLYTCLLILIDSITQLLARLEMWYELAIQTYRLAGFGVAPNARRAIVQREAAEATNLDTIPRSQRLGHLLQHGLDGQLDILGGKLALVGDDSFDQLRLGHGFPFFFKRLEDSMDRL